ncbi:hypothetical protein [Benzoatithermus flavus]|uniref:Uncharacterized protein n=1 Tax=Benzoatithermus flavus TaxID=3108223 RepID=A0ABU8XQI0_9PROT
MRVTNPRFTVAAGVMLFGISLLGPPVHAQDNGQGATNAITPPSTQQDPTVLRPKPSPLPGRPDAGTAQTHQNDTASPGGGTGTTTGTTGSGVAGGTTRDQNGEKSDGGTTILVPPPPSNHPGQPNGTNRQ